MQKDPGKRIDVTTTTVISADLVRFLESVRWGTGDTAYKAGAIQEKLSLVPNPVFFMVYIDENVIGAVVFSERTLSDNGQPAKASYIRYLAIAPEISGKAAVKTFGSRVLDYLKEKKAAGYILYTCIEMQNSISQGIVSKLGFRKMAKVGVIGFSRLFPRTRPQIRQLETVAEKQQVLALLESRYKDHFLLQFDSLNLSAPGSNYYAYYENGRIIAGVQVSKGNWKIDNLGTANHSLLVKLLPRIPFLNKYFNPGNFRFITFDGIYTANGKRKNLLMLFEHLLKIYKVRAAVFWLDEQSPLYEAVTKNGNLGFLHSIVKSSGSFIYVDLPGHGALPAQPVYVSSKELV